MMNMSRMKFNYANGNMAIVNMETGKVRVLSEGCRLLVDDCEIDYDAIEQQCVNGIHNARAKAIRYAGLGRWDDFKDGLCAISWMLYPDGQYFADSDGYGMEDNDEEVVYAIIDTDLNIVEPFRPVKNVETYLKEVGKNVNYHKNIEISQWKQK